jgi:ribonucleoside-diphosphate reductase alpha chain
VIDVTNYPLPEIENETKQVRRIGIGVAGLHDMLILLGLDYDYKGIDFIEKLMTFIRDEAYKSSSDLSAKKGSFPVYNHAKYMEGEFIKDLPPHIKGIITQKGIRNATLLTMAPTGTTSIVCGVSSGIEPIFSLGFKRTIRSEKGKEVRYVVHPLVEVMQKDKRDISKILVAHNIDTRVHLEMQKVCQKYVDSAIAKTINLPASILKDKAAQLEMADLLLEYMPHLKGVTLYADGCRGDAPIQGLSIEDILKMNGCKSGTCGI